MIKPSLLSVALLTATISAHAEVIVKDKTETFTETVKVSGTFLQGLMMKSTGDFSHLAIAVPSGYTSQPICLNLTSIDGRYSATINALASSSSSLISSFKLDSAYAKELREFSTNEVAIDARVGSCSSKKHLFSAWADGSDEIINGKVSIYIRSNARWDEALATSSTSGTICKKIKQANAIAFDKYCSIDVSNSSDIDSIEFKRRALKPISPVILEFGRDIIE